MKLKLILLSFFIYLIINIHDVNAGCNRPNLESFLESSWTVLNFRGTYLPGNHGIWLESDINGSIIQWLGTYWEGPVGGALFVFDCNGKLITVSKIGAVSKLSKYSQNQRLPNSVIVEYTAGTGTGLELKKIAIFNFDNNKINEIWGHDLYEKVFVPPLKQFEKTYSIDIRRDGMEIKVKGKIKTYPDDWDGKDNSVVKVTHTIPEVFCWDDSGYFKKCNQEKPNKSLE